MDAISCMLHTVYTVYIGYILHMHKYLRTDHLIHNLTLVSQTKNTLEDSKYWGEKALQT